MNQNSRNPISWVPTVYFAMGLPFVVLNMVSVLMFKGLGIGDAQIALWTSLIMLPWTLKFLWSPFLEMFKTKKFFVVLTQLITGAGFALVALALHLPAFFAVCIALLAVIAFSGATHDVATDGVYMSELNKQDQAKYIGWQGAFYNIAKIVASGGLVWLAGWLLKTAIIEMLSGGEVKVNTATFKNDTVNIQSKDDVLTYMIHLGYLGYDQNRKTAFVPNEEIRQELTLAVESKHWNEMLLFQQESEKLLDATLDMDGDAVATQVEKIHDDYVSAIQYNNENSLSSVLAIAYLSAMQYYFKPVRELPTGRGFADFVFVPKPEYRNDYPALVVELKWNKNADTAMQQIRERQYPNSLLQYTGNVLLVAINYDEKTKEHVCKIEEYAKIQN